MFLRMVNLFTNWIRRFTMDIYYAIITFLTKGNRQFHRQQLIILAMFGAMDETIAPRIGGPRLGL